MDDYDFLFKVVLIGNAGVGKTCLVRKFTQGVFPPGQSATIGVDFMIKTLKLDGKRIKLQIWDTAGQERFRSITQSYYRSAHAIVLVYDVCSQPTFDCISEWMGEIEQYANKRALKILVGNKVDKDEEREIPTHIGQTFAAGNGFDYLIETSAVSSANVDILFQEVAGRLAEREAKQQSQQHRYAGSNEYGRRTTNADGGTVRPGMASETWANLMERAQRTRCCEGGGAMGTRQ